MTSFRSAQVLVTGAAGGIGRRMALGAARRGASLVIWDVNRDGLVRLAEEIEALGATARAFRCDVSDRDAVYRVAREVNAVGPPDVVINNAGVVSGKPFLETPDEQIEKSLKVNTLSLFWTTKAFLPGMIDRGGGHVVTVASAAGLIGVRRLSDYCASKFAAVGFDEALRFELASTAPAVRTTVVCPYYIGTGMFRGVKTRFPFLLPILDEGRVAKKILRAVETNRPRLFMPPIVYTIPLLRLLPVSWFDAIARLMGVQASMDEFRGHEPSRSEPGG